VGKEIELRIGTPVLADKLARIGNEQQATNYLRWRTYLLARRERVPELPPPPPPQQNILSPTDSQQEGSEIPGLGPRDELDENRDFRVLVADASRIPHTLLEIGRQRELAFRDAGEGTGKELDLDRFDAHYQHLILWHKKDAQVAGGYRFANTREVLITHGL